MGTLYSEVIAVNFKSLLAALQGVTVYKDVLDTPVMEAALRLARAAAWGDGSGGLEAYTDLFYRLRTEGHAGLGSWLNETLRWSESPYPLLAEGDGRDPALEQAARRDVSAFALLADIDCDKWIARLTELLDSDYQGVLTGLPRWQSGVPFSFSQLTAAYRAGGAGRFARYRAFVWEDGQLLPVERPDAPRSEELLGYTRQRDAVLRNTELLMEGRYVNNVLLYGESGTGKSATVKNLLTLPGMEELRIIEADKENLGGLPALIRGLEGRRQKFIIFIDDLAFDRDDATYSVLKTILEGGLERRPANVAVYATSNRRHLVRQTISERAGDEMDRSETIREKTSLADRFGLRVLYQGLTKQEYLDVVDMLARRSGLDMIPEELHQKAVAWERLHGAQTPRTALQFILSL